MPGSDDAGKDLTIRVRNNKATINLYPGCYVHFLRRREGSDDAGGSKPGSSDFKNTTINFRPDVHAGFRRRWEGSDGSGLKRQYNKGLFNNQPLAGNYTTINLILSKEEKEEEEWAKTKTTLGPWRIPRANY